MRAGVLLLIVVVEKAWAAYARIRHPMILGWFDVWKGFVLDHERRREWIPTWVAAEESAVSLFFET